MSKSNAAALPNDDRRSLRTYVQMRATLAAAPGKRVEVSVVNVSASGMMIETPANFVPGRPVSVDVESIGTFTGKTAWARDGHIGLTFDKPLSLDQMMAFE